MLASSLFSNDCRIACSLLKRVANFFFNWYHRIEEIHTMLKEQSKILKAIGQREGVEETGNRKSIIGWFLKKH